MFRLSATLAAVVVAQSVDDLFDLEEEVMAPAPTPAAPKAKFVPRKLEGLDDEDEDWTPPPAPPQAPAPAPAPTVAVDPTSTGKHSLCTWGYWKGRDLAHHDIYSLGVPDGISSKNAMLAHCRTVCESEANCHGFAWFAAGKKCEFKAGLKSTFNTQFLGSGGNGGHDMHVIIDLDVCKPNSPHVDEL